jgi:hypothetical protein
VVQPSRYRECQEYRRSCGDAGVPGPGCRRPSYANADIRKGEEADEIFRFIDFWKRQHGKAPQHLVFDSKLTTYAGPDRLEAAGITFITLRRRSPKLLAEVADQRD